MAQFKDRLEAGLKMKDMTPAELSKATGIGEGAISQYRKGAYKATQRNLEKISAALGVSIPWLMGITDDESAPLPPGLMPMPNFLKKPRLGTIACGKPILAVEEAETFDNVPEGVSCDFTLKCKGDSMINARIFDGDIVYIRKQDMVDNGEIAAVLIGDETTLKRVRIYDDHIILAAENPTFQPLVYWGEEMNSIRILGKAVAFTSPVI